MPLPTPPRCLILILAACAGPITAEEPLRPLDRELLGVWQQVDADEDDEPLTVEITPTHWSKVRIGRLEWRAPVLGQNDDEIVIVVSGNRQHRRFELDGDTLAVTYTKIPRLSTGYAPSSGWCHSRSVASLYAG